LRAVNYGSVFKEQRDGFAGITMYNLFAYQYAYTTHSKKHRQK